MTAHSEVEIGALKLKVLASDASWYKGRHVFEESESVLYRLLSREGFANFVDVGANCGLVSCLARKALPAGRLFAVEADPRLAPLVAENCAANGLEPPKVFHAVASDRAGDAQEFSLNPGSSLDNRVSMPNWKRVSVPAMSLDQLFESEKIAGKTFVKIDTQGYEETVLRGFRQTMDARDDWVIKMEFAPLWLQSQGTDPVALVRELSAKFLVAEVPGRLAYTTPSLRSLLRRPVGSDQAAEFVAYVKALNVREQGWVDLFVAPKSMRETFLERLRGAVASA